MDLDAYERFNADINTWVEKQRGELDAAGIKVIECADLIQENPNAVILPTKGFQPFCAATDQHVVFLYRGECDVSARIQAVIAEVCEDSEDSAPMIRAFEIEHALLMKRAEQVCRTHFYAEFTVLHQGGFVSAGVVCQAYEDLLEALQTFCKHAEDRRAEAKEAQLSQDEEALEQLAEELSKDSNFAAIRGKRKRCVYVKDRYGLRVPRSPKGDLRRVDQTCDPMDANLVSLVERISDRLELLRPI